MSEESYSAWEEYKALKKHRLKIDARMRELKDIATSFNRAKYGFESDSYYIAIKHINKLGEPRWVKVVSAKSKKDAFDQIPTIIESLNGLYRKLVKDAD